jgi:S-adenosylmethionine:tRNA ribosyltransferase-isomerase
MHTEHYHVSEEAAISINKNIAAGKTLVAVGTTSVRTLESAAVMGAHGWQIAAGYGDTDLFITPEYKFKLVQGMVTNFHLPKSSLLVLVSGFLGTKFAKDCYKHAVDKQYRFFSYGDAMLVL